MSRTNVHVELDPAKPEGVAVVWDEEQLPNRPPSAHIIIVSPYFDFARNKATAEVIAAALGDQEP